MLTKSCKGLTQNYKPLVQLQLVITSIVSNSLTPIRSGQNVGPDLGPNYLLKWLSADDNVIKRLNAKLKYIGSTSTCHYRLKCQTVWTQIRSGQNVGPDLGPNCLKHLSADVIC